MTAVKITISLLVPLALGYSWLGLFRSAFPLGTRLSLAVGLGFGLSSLLFFGWILAAGRASAIFMLFQGLAALALIAAGWLSRRRLAPPSASAEPPSSLERNLRWAFFLTLLFSLGVSMLQFLYAPHGHWDAWDLWNMRALFLVKAGRHWPEFFLPEMTRNMDYPLMLSGAIAAAWKFVGSPQTWVPGSIAILFTLATVGLLTSSLRAIRSRSQGWIAGILLASTPMFAQHGASQYADIQIAFYILGSVGLWTWSDDELSPSYTKIALSGMLAGLAAWTKNEGELLIMAMVLARIFCRARPGNYRATLREMGIWLLGASPFLLATIYFKASIAPPNDLFSKQSSAQLLEKLSESGRYLVIAKTWAETLPVFGNWRFGIPVALLIYAAAVGRSAITPKLRHFPLLTLILISAGYFLTYVVTPYSIPWHLSTSLNRLLFQLWPLALFTGLLWLRTPEEFASAQ